MAKALILHGAEATGDLLDNATYQKAREQAEAEAFSSFKNASGAHDDDDDD